MSLNCSLIKSISSFNSDDNDISIMKKELEEKIKANHKNKKKKLIKNIIKKQKEQNNSFQEIYRNDNKKLIQYKTTKDNTCTNTCATESSLNTKKFEKFINKKISEPPPEKFDYEFNDEKKDDLNFLRKVLCSRNFCKDKKSKNSLRMNDLRKYIIVIEKRVKDNEVKLINYNISDFTREIYNLFARFSFIIFIVLENQKFEQAKDVFLLMLKENIKYINHMEVKIIDVYQSSKHCPKETYELLRIYAFIIKYSRFFNMTYYCNIFLGRYLEVIYYIYNWFNNRDHAKGSNLDIKNHINYWFSLVLHNATYISILYYFPINLSINLNKMIIDLYEDINENLLTYKEKSLIIKVLYNLSLSYYLNGQNEKALNSLNGVRDKILNSENFSYLRNSIFNKNFKKKQNVNIISKNVDKNGNELISKEEDGNRLSTANSFSEFVNNKIDNDNDSINKLVEEEKIKETYSKNKIKLEDIELLINYGLKYGLIKNKNSSSFNQINILSKKLSIPNYFNNPLLRKLELLIGEIELDKKNYKSAYEHILKAFYIIILLKLCKKSEEYTSLYREQKIIEKYLTLIEKLKEKEIDNSSEEKSEISSFDNSLDPSSIINNDDSFKDNYKKDYGDIILNKYNLNLYLNKGKEQKSSSKIILVSEKEIDYKLMQDMEKFFMFLCTLSIFQISLLNETQPDSVKRNDLPILFSSQFKDCLSMNQRNALNNLQTMALNRFDVLKNPNGFIVPNNININIIKEKKMEKYKRKRTFKFINKYDEDENNDIQIRQTKEFKLYLKIINSGRLEKEVKEFLKNNLYLVLKVLKKTDGSAIDNIIESPNIIIEPIKHYKRQKKKYFETLNIKKKLELLNNKNKYNFRNKNLNYRMSTIGIGTFKSKLKLEQNKDINKKRETIEDNPERLRLSSLKGKRNKSKLGQMFNLQFNEDKPNKKDTKDYNDNYNEYQISIQSSLKDEN